MRIDDVVTFASEAALDLAEAQAKAGAWKAKAVGEAERIRMEVPGAREFMSGDARLGALRLDGADLPATTLVTDGAAFAGHLVKYAPGEATASVTIPADRADDLRQALEFLGITGAVSFAAIGGGAAYLKDHCKIVADPELPSGWKVLAITDDGTTVPVPGVTGTRPVPTWKLIPNNEKRKERIAAAVEMVDEQADSIRDAVAASAIPETEVAADLLEIMAEAEPPSGLDEFDAATTHNPIMIAVDASALPAKALARRKAKITLSDGAA